MFRSDLLRSKPGGSSFLLQMAIDAAYSPENPSKCGPYTDNKGNDFYGIPYEVNTLGANIRAPQ
jgi:hypothetical protein